MIALGAVAALASISYYDTSRATDHKYFLRLQMVLHTGSHGIHVTARAFGCLRNTVRQWLRRFEHADHARRAFQRCATRWRRSDPAMVRRLDVDRIVFSIFNRMNPQWEKRTLQL